MMSQPPLLLIGGTGVIGRSTARLLRTDHPTLSLLIGSRDLEKANAVAAEIGCAEGVALDMAADDLGIGDRPVGAVAVFYKDETIAGLRFAQSRGVPHVSISSGVFEIAPEIAAYMHQPHAAAIVLGYEWLVGATTIPTLDLAKEFGRIEEIIIGALVDEQDTGGPTVAADFERLNRLQPAALTRRAGAYIWRTDQDAKTGFTAVDDTLIKASGFSSIDVVGLATATGSPNVQFNLGSGVSSSRRRGGTMSTEIIIEIVGEDQAGKTLRSRHAVVHRGGAAPLTALGVSMIIERLTGLDGAPPTPAGLYFPFQVLDNSAYLSRLEQSGGAVLKLEAIED